MGYKETEGKEHTCAEGAERKAVEEVLESRGYVPITAISNNHINRTHERPKIHYPDVRQITGQ